MIEMRKFILIGGVGRSGTNLIRRILGSNSKIAIPPGEFRFFSQYVNGCSIKEILSNDRLKTWNLDFTSFYSCEHKEVFINILLNYMENAGKEIPGEKTPGNEFYYDIIQEWLKDFHLKFIHMVRNPFDVAASYKFAPFNRNQSKIKVDDILVLSRNWRRSISMGLARAHLNTDNYYLIKYEDLVGSPINTTQKVCSFLGITFEKERMLSFSDYKGHKDNTSFQGSKDEKSLTHGSVFQPVSRKHYLSNSEIKVISSVCGELACALGYEDNDFHSSLPERKLNIKRRLKRKLINISGLNNFSKLNFRKLYRL